jgi:hypothetical protein
MINLRRHDRETEAVPIDDAAAVGREHADGA